MRLGFSASLLLSTGLISAGCTPLDNATRCDISEVALAVQAADRKLLGVASPYPADFMLRGQEDQLHHSQRLRRQAAWSAIAKVLAPVELAENLPFLPANIPARVPRFQTWYGRDDISRLFIHLYDGLGPDGRQERARFDSAALDDAVVWNANMLDELSNWPEERWLAYLQAIDDASKVAGIGGVGRVSYSPSAARHLLSSYPEMLACEDQGAPAAFTDGPDPGTRQLVREPVRLQACGARTFGPFFVAADESLNAVLEGDTGDSQIAVYRMIASDRQSQEINTWNECRAHTGEHCSVSGPGGLYVRVRAGTADVDQAVLAIDYHEAQPTWSACLQQPFAVDAAVVKTEWRRAQFGLELPVYDTSGGRMAERLVPGGEADWGQGDGHANPGPETIYTMTLPNGNTFRLAGLHIMTKELDHWLWTTLWWSPEPNTDFGADRPTDIELLGGPWAHYKMCAVTMFADDESDPTGGFDAVAPSLGRALSATYEGEGAPSWCSNPYIEVGAGNAGTNCIGCHQHGGTDIDLGAILAGPMALPEHGRTHVRNNFPTDYSWAVNAGDRLDRMFADVVDYYDGFE